MTGSFRVISETVNSVNADFSGNVLAWPSEGHYNQVIIDWHRRTIG
jgi:hypothetical protein